jgi:outer membrane receptor for ferrienterochelin and colicin
MFKSLAFFFLIICLFLLTPFNDLRAQNGTASENLFVKGILIDPTDNLPLAGATLFLENQQGTVIKSTVSADTGIFAIALPQKGSYRIKATYIGFVDYISELITVDSESIDLGTIMIFKKEELLESVTITTRKRPLIENKGDRMIYNAGSDISNKAGTATDVLRKAPMLTVGAEGEVKMRGNSNIKVLLNGMPSGIIAKNLKEALKMISASSIETVEVITNPSAKYDAEGAAGVINIITKKKIKGTSGNLDLAGGNLEQSANLALNMAVEKFNFSLLLNTSNSKELSTSLLDRTSLLNGQANGRLVQKREATQRNKGNYGSFTTEYKIDSLQKVETTISFWKGGWPTKSNLYNLYKKDMETSQYNQKSNQDAAFNYYDISLNYQKKFKREGQEIQFVGQASKSDDASEYTTDQFRPDGVLVFTERSPNKGNNTDWSAQLDYAHPISKTGKNTIDIGAKYLGNKSKSDYKVFNTLNPVAESRSDVMRYFQNIFSAYVSINLKTDTNWGFRPGLRFETTSLGGAFQNNTPSFGSNYKNWVPSMLITKKLNEKHEMKLNYTERVRRPWIWDLNPYVDASDPNNITSGNPNLKPELNRMLELGHAYSATSGFSLNSSLYFHSNSNAIESITTLDAAGVSYTTSQNIAANRRLGTNLNASLQLNDNWILNTGGELFYLKFNSKSMNLHKEGVFYTVNLNNSYTLPNDFSIMASGEYGNGYITLQGENSANYSYRFAARKEMLNKKASLTLSTTNPFQNKFSQRSRATAPSFESTTSTSFYNRSITLSFAWQFGGLKSSDYAEKRFSGQDNAKSIPGGFKKK